MFYLTDEIAITRKPIAVENFSTGESVRFKSVDEALEHKIGDLTVREMILQIDKPKTPALNGGRGAGSGSQGTFKFGHADRRGSGNNRKELPPALANTQIKAKSLEGALEEFKKKHLDSDHEWAYEVDSSGYVHQYIEGARSSVGIGASAKVKRGEQTMIIHNHPSGSAFSDSDLLSVSAQSRAKGIIASGKKYDYKFEKGSHFDASGFTKAVRTAKMKGKDYDDAVDKWLRKNASKFGYKYSRTKNKPSKKK